MNWRNLMEGWLGAKKIRTSSRRKARPSGTTLHCEKLEDRTVLSTIVALSESSELLTFESTAPGVILSRNPITGLQAGESLLGIDMRPATGELIGLGSANNLYAINGNSGAATLKAVLTADPTDSSDPFTGLVGADFGIDFNPVVDRLRVVSDADQNLRINPDTGVVITDSPLAYDAADPNAGVDPTITDAAYSNNVAGASSTTLFVIDSPLHKLATLGGAGGAPSPNSGLLFTGAAFGKAGVVTHGLDIAPSGTAFAVAELVFGPGDVDFVLTTIDLAGQDQSQGRIADGVTRIRDIAVMPSLQLSRDIYAVREGAGSAPITVTRTEGGVGTFTVEFDAISGTAKAGQDFVRTHQVLTFAPGETSKTVNVPIINDRLGEGDEFLVVVLSDPEGGAVLGGPGDALLRISANDRVDRTGPRVTSFGLTGPSRGITGAVVHFNEDLNRATAQNVANYRLFGFGDQGRRQIQFTAAVYDEATRTVRLTAATPFRQADLHLIEFEVNGKKGGVKDAAGNLLDGDENGKPGGNASLLFRVFSGTTVTLRDSDGDRATLTVDTPETTIDGIEPIRAPKTQMIQFWLVNVTPLATTLSGTVQKSSTGDGIIVIAEIIGLDKKEFKPTTLLPAYTFNRITYSTNATGM